MVGVDCLLNKNILPKEFIWKLYHSDFFKEHPEILIQVAQAVNLAKMSRVALEMAMRGEMTSIAYQTLGKSKVSGDDVMNHKYSRVGKRAQLAQMRRRALAWKNMATSATMRQY